MTHLEIMMSNVLFLSVAMSIFLILIWPELRYWAFVVLLVMLILVLSPLFLLPVMFTKVPDRRKNYEAE